MMPMLYGAAGNEEIFGDLEKRRNQSLCKWSAQSSRSRSSLRKLSDDRHSKRSTRSTDKVKKSKAARTAAGRLVDDSLQVQDDQEQSVGLSDEQKDAISSVSEEDPDFAQVLELIFSGERDINKAIYEFGPTALQEAAEKGYTDIVELLIENKANVNESAGDNYTPLHYAIKNDNYEIAEILIENGADVDNQPDGDEDHPTPLYLAVECGWQDFVELLIDNDADIDKVSGQDINGSPLYIAAYLNDPDIVKFLIERGADINRVNNHGETPLDVAKRGGYMDIVKLLTDSEARINYHNE
jgi:ankyrin repeat protein